VFAITQLSHFLLKHLDWIGLVEAAVLFLAVWWAWMFTTWAANWADPERVPVRIMLLAVMLLSMLMAAALPHAFEDTALLFAGSYIAIQIGRSVFMVWAMRGSEDAGVRNMVRIALWFCVSAAAWIMGAIAEPTSARLAWWAGALLFEYLGPAAGFCLPLLGRSRPGDWTISGSHMAERSALFIIIALGEGVIVTGTSFAALPISDARIASFLLAFLSSVLMWWIYFDVGAERGAKHIENHDEPGRVARGAYTYLHMPIVAGIVIAAVADALLLQAPLGAAPHGLVLTQCAGSMMYLLGTGAFKKFSSPLGNFPLSHWVGAGLLCITAAWGWLYPPSALAFVAGANAVLVVVAAWEWISFHGGWTARLSAKATR